MKNQNISGITKTRSEVSYPTVGKPFEIGEGFKALSFKHDQFNGLIDPIVMVDHYTMTQSTFGEHPHAGMSAVSILFEDSKGVFNNKDSLGNDIDLKPGDAYWLKAGAGATHDEKPTSGSLTHGLQIFVNLPKALKHDTPAALHVPASKTPILQGAGYRVRVVFGESNGIKGSKTPALSFTALDGHIEKNGAFKHLVKHQQSAFIYAVKGPVMVETNDQKVNLSEGQAISMQTMLEAEKLTFSTPSEAHFVVLQGSPIREQFVQQGPFVMSNLEEIKSVVTAYEAGLLGSIPKTA